MATASLANWTWIRYLDARIEDGLIVREGDFESYTPGENRAGLLTAIQKVRDEQRAVLFVRQWGLLGFAMAAPRTEALIPQFDGALGFAWSTRRQENPSIDFKGVVDEVTSWHDQRTKIRLRRDDRGEPIQWILDFAETMRFLSNAIYIQGLFREDPTAADYDAKKWVKSLSPECYETLVGPDLEFWKEQYNRGYTERYFYQYLLNVIITEARLRFSHRSQRGIWVKINPRDGRPLFEFDSLFRFIEYSLLSDNAPSPKRCEDPQCGQLFFPIRSSRRYCPPPPGHKRSLCEQRHTKQLRRAKVASETPSKEDTARLP